MFDLTECMCKTMKTVYHKKCLDKKEIFQHFLNHLRQLCVRGCVK